MDFRKWKNIEEYGKILDKKEIEEFLSKTRNNLPYHVNPDDRPKLNRLCYVEDWQNPEVRDALAELQKLNPQGFIHRKDWEWAIGLIAMKRFGKINESSTAIGVGSGIEPIPFYLANKISRVYATDLYEDDESWKQVAPSEFLKDPKKYSPFPYREDALTVLRMSGAKLDFPDESFDIAFSFSSIEHFGGENHSGSLKAMREIERVLKPGGIAVISNRVHPQRQRAPGVFQQKNNTF